MSDSIRASAGTRYTMTTALLVMAFFFCPAVWMASRPVSNTFLSITIACGALCIILAWFNWKKSSRVTVPSIITDDHMTL